MKKIISIVFLLLIIIGSYKNVYASENIVVEKRTLDNGNVQVLLKVDETSAAYGGSITYSYDNSSMEIAEVLTCSDENYLIIINKDYQNEGNKIRVVFASSKIVQGDLAVIEFQSLNDNGVNIDGITVDQVELSDNNGAIINGATIDNIQINTTFGASLIDDSIMKKYEDDTDNSTIVNETDSINKDNINITDKQDNSSKSTKQETTNNKFVFVVGVGIIVIMVIGFMFYKKKKH